MTFADFIRTWRGQQLVMMGALALSAVLGLAVFVMVAVLKSREQIVVLVPPDLEGEASVTRSGASADYKRAWAPCRGATSTCRHPSATGARPSPAS